MSILYFSSILPLFQQLCSPGLAYCPVHLMSYGAIGKPHFCYHSHQHSATHAPLMRLLPLHMFFKQSKKCKVWMRLLPAHSTCLVSRAARDGGQPQLWQPKGRWWASPHFSPICHRGEQHCSCHGWSGHQLPLSFLTPHPSQHIFWAHGQSNALEK